MMDIIYYEAHVTIEPVFDTRLEMFKKICSEFGFRAAELLMKKRKEDSLTRSAYDSFCTGRSKEYDDLHNRMTGLVDRLKDSEFQVWRYKLEATLTDVRLKG